MGQFDKLLLSDVGQVRIARHEASNTLVGVLDSTFLPGRIWITEPASSAYPIFQSPKAAKLGTAVEGETLAGEGRQG